MTSPLATLTAHCCEFDLSLLEKRDCVAIYFLICDGVIVYVGQTAQLAPRLVMHAATGKTFDRVLTVDVPAADGDLCEGALIRLLNPPLCFGAPRNTGRDAEALARFGLQPDPDASEQFEFRRWERRTSGDRFWQGIAASAETRMKMYRNRKAPQESRRGNTTAISREVQRQRAQRLFAALEHLYAGKVRAS